MKRRSRSNILGWLVAGLLAFSPTGAPAQVICVTTGDDCPPGCAWNFCGECVPVDELEDCVGGGCYTCCKPVICGIEYPCGWPHPQGAFVQDYVIVRAEVYSHAEGLTWEFEITEGSELVEIVEQDGDELLLWTLTPGHVEVVAQAWNHPCAFGCGCEQHPAQITIRDDGAGICDDCNLNGVEDPIELVEGTATDCNYNGVPDECDIASGLSQDWNENGIPDECECCCLDITFVVDDSGSMQDDIDHLGIVLPQLAGISHSRGSGDTRYALVTFNNTVEVDRSLEPDLPSFLDLVNGLVAEGGAVEGEASYAALLTSIADLETPCGSTGSFDVPYRSDCQKKIFLMTDEPPRPCASIEEVVAAATAAEVEINIVGIGPDHESHYLPICEATGGIYASVAHGGAGMGALIRVALDACLRDCDDSQTPDAFEIQSDPDLDLDGDGLIDMCEPCVADVNEDGVVDFGDIVGVLAEWGPCSCPGPCLTDLDGDHEVGMSDLLYVLAHVSAAPTCP